MVVEGFKELVLLAEGGLLLSLELVSLFIPGSGVLLKLLLKAGPHELKGLRRYLDASVELLDLSFDPLQGYGWHLACSALGEPAIADEVLILDALVAGGLLEDEPRAAVSAPDGGLEEVVVLAFTLALLTAAERRLDLVEETLRDQGLMVAGVLHAAIGGDAEVVLVRQHGVDVALADRF